MLGVMHNHVHLQSLQGYPEEMDHLRYDYGISGRIIGKHSGPIWEPCGTHVGTSGLFCIEIPEGAHWVPTDKNRRVPAGNPVRVPDGIPDGSLKGTDWCVWLGTGHEQTRVTLCSDLR